MQCIHHNVHTRHIHTHKQKKKNIFKCLLHVRNFQRTWIINHTQFFVLCSHLVCSSVHCFCQLWLHIVALQCWMSSVFIFMLPTLLLPLSTLTFQHFPLFFVVANSMQQPKQNQPNHWTNNQPAYDEKRTKKIAIKIVKLTFSRSQEKKLFSCCFDRFIIRPLFYKHTHTHTQC